MSFYFRRIPEEYEESNGLEVTVYKDPAGQLSKLVKIEQAAAYVFWFSNNTNVHESTLRVSFRALVGVNYAIQVDSAYDVGGQFHLNPPHDRHRRTAHVVQDVCYHGDWRAFPRQLRQPVRPLDGVDEVGGSVHGYAARAVLVAIVQYRHGGVCADEHRHEHVREAEASPGTRSQTIMLRTTSQTRSSHGVEGCPAICAVQGIYGEGCPQYVAVAENSCGCQPYHVDSGKTYLFQVAGYGNDDNPISTTAAHTTTTPMQTTT